MKSLLYISFGFLLIFSETKLKGQNFALHRPYTLSVPPNYQYTAAASDKISLTDGIYTKGLFWTQPTTVGWINKRRVTINIDLGKTEPIDSVTFNTVRSVASSAFFPENIYVFISNDNNSFNYVGDAAQIPENTSGSYIVKKFILSNIQTKGRYVLVYIIPKGNVLFCDEIEVLGGKKENLLRNYSIFKDDLDKYIDSLQSLQYKQQYLKETINKLLNNSNQVRNKEFSNIENQLQKNDLSSLQLSSLYTSSLKLHALNLKNKYKEPFLIEKYNPWDTLSEMSTPTTDVSQLTYQFVLPRNAVQYGAFVIHNFESSSQSFALKITNLDTSILKVQIFQVPFVNCVNFHKTPDPLVSITKNIKIDAGYSEMFLFKITGVGKGATSFNIAVGSTLKRTKLNISSQIKDWNLEQNIIPINANVWAYLNYPILKDRSLEAALDLKLHHINTVVLLPAILPTMKNQDSTTLLNYLNNFSGTDNFLISTNFSSEVLRNGYKNGHFLSSEWKSKFITWYKSIVNLIRQNGFPNAKIYLYPYDEVHGNDITDFKSLIEWTKAEVPGIKFYATLNNESAVNSLLPLLDIAQIQSSYKGLTTLPAHSCDIWIYSTEGAARSLSPYSYYRLMSWQAFINDYKGIGFWDYADEGREKKLNLISDPLPTQDSYSVIYDGPGKQIISSRRWEAFKLGIEDYAILQQYARRKGKKSAEELAKTVTSSPNSLMMADSVRNVMLRSL
jgi:hypothetical protein